MSPKIISISLQTQPNNPPDILLLNPWLLWGIICLQAIGLAVLGYYFWKFRARGVDLKTSDHPKRKSPSNVEFSELTHPEQFNRLQELAISALEHYPLELSRITKIEYRLNASFLAEAMRSDQPEIGIQKYFIKVNTPGVQTRAAIDSEMLWLKAIGNDTDLSVPEPLRNDENALVTTIDHPSVPESRHCTIVSWLEGTSPHSHLTEEILEEAGVFIGKLHQQVSGYHPPSGFERKHWDLAGFQSEMLDVPVTKIRRGLNKDQIGLIEGATEKILSAVSNLEKSPEDFGLIHGNFQEKNYLVHRGEIRGINFDSCGWGFFGYELAVMLSQLVNRSNFPQLRTALLNGYRQVRLIGEDNERLLGTFIAGRYVYDMLSLAGQQNETDEQNEATHLIDRYTNYLERFLQRG